MNPWLGLALAVVLLLANAGFVWAEFALMSVRRSALEPLAEKGSQRAALVLAAQDQVSDVLACAQLGITVSSTSLGALAEPAVAGLLREPLEGIGLSAAAAHPVAAVVAVVLVVYLHVVLGEMVPKSLAIAGPERSALILTPTLLRLTHLVGPILRALNWLANRLVRVLGVTPRPEMTAAFTAEEVASIVERSQAEGVLEDREGLLAGALEFSDLTASEVALPLAEVVCVPPDVTPSALEKLVAQHGFSRFPVTGPSGGLIGYLHIMDTLAATGPDRDRPVDPTRIRRLAQVKPEAEIETALAVMQASRAHMVQVGRNAVLFLEDILEELVGEIRDPLQRPH